MTDPKTPPPQVWPTLRATDARTLIRFLVDAFGFEETAVHGTGDRVEHAELSWPLGGGIMLGSDRGEATDGGEATDAWPLKPGTFGCYVVADDIDALHDRALKAGAEILEAPYDTDYGSRDFRARDPEGNLWSFGTYRGEPRA
ncbi:VOC family protein [Actinoplanes sp. TRM 88003]|uniref:VOC family protein n=1 Tax=Paractinoplanes aksuensis TaxID=2939490 RepID=A0ABT1E1Q7_9ACTN|nr:VOC family protein [Actinoplanes aksuensis]MCO8276967.1 VOC family protein [Actinoplanes aksuensis]